MFCCVEMKCSLTRGKSGDDEEEEDEDDLEGKRSAMAKRAGAKKAIKAEAEYESDVSFPNILGQT